MSTGGIFKLITNTGAQDKLLLANDYLKSRLNHLAKLNKKKQNQHCNSLFNGSIGNDIHMISKSHVIFTNGAYKPFVATGFEYNKVSSNGNILFGSNVTFTIPVFGDYVNDAVIHVKMTGLRAVNNKDRVRYVSMIGHKLFSNVSLTGRFTYYSYGMGSEFAAVNDVQSLIFGTNLSF